MAYIPPSVGTQMPTPPQSPTLGPERVRNPEQEYWLKGTGARVGFVHHPADHVKGQSRSPQMACIMAKPLYMQRKHGPKMISRCLRNFYAVSSSGRFGAPDAPWGVCNLRYPYVDPQEKPYAVAGQSKAHTWPQPATDK